MRQPERIQRAIECKTRSKPPSYKAIMIRLASRRTSFRCLHQTTPGVLPAAFMDEPLLDEHSRQLAIHFAQDAPGLFAAPVVDLPMLFPQPEESFERPSEARASPRLR